MERYKNINILKDKNGKKFRVVDIITNKEVIETVKGEERTNAYNVIVIGGHEDLNNTSRSLKWGTAKDDVTPEDIFWTPLLAIVTFTISFAPLLHPSEGLVEPEILSSTNGSA